MATNPTTLHGWTPVPLDPSLILAGKKNAKDPDPVTVDSIHLRTTDLARQVLDYAKTELSEQTFNHSMRAYYYGQSSTPHTPPTAQANARRPSRPAATLPPLAPQPRNLPPNQPPARHRHHIHKPLLHAAQLRIPRRHTRPHAALPTPVRTHPQAEAVTEAIIRHQDIGTSGIITTFGGLIQLATMGLVEGIGGCGDG